MRAAACFALLFGLINSSFVSADPDTVPAISSLADLIPPKDSDDSTLTTKYIVELASSASDSDGSLTRRRKRSLTPHEDFFNELSKRGIQVKRGTEWDLDDLFVGVEIVVQNVNDITSILAQDNVVAVRPVVNMGIPPQAKQEVLSDSSSPVNSQSTHVMTGVDKVHAEGNLGQGVKVGVIDTGVDYMHPFLGGGFGPGFVVTGGYDFVGDAYTGGNTPVPDNDPMDTCNGHGTFTAGIIAAQPGNQYNITGVAYKSTINAYRVLGCTGVVEDPIVVNAMLKAYDDGMNVITMSLSVLSGWTTGTTSVIASRLAAKGIVVLGSAGNNGALGAYYTAAPSSGIGVISVGSVENTELPVVNATLSDGHAPVPYLGLRAFPVTGAIPVYATSTDITIPNDACTALPSSTPNLSGYLVVIRKGGCAATTKLANAAAKGGRYFFIYNDNSAFKAIDVGPYIASAIRAEDGAYLVNAFASNPNLRVSFPNTGVFDSIPQDLGGIVNDFTTIGPTYDLQMKPSIVAPGGSVVSLLPRNMGSFAVASGTSMACPFAAGSAALILKAKGNNRGTGRTVKSLLQVTAGMVPSSTLDNAPPATAAQQGAGLIDVYQAIHARTTVSTSEILLNDTQYGNPSQWITLWNPTNKKVTYTITHTPAVTVQTIKSANGWANLSPLPTSDKTANVKFSSPSGNSNKLTALPYLPAVIIVSIKPPPGADASTFPVYSGYITISSSLGETFSIPYMGMAAKMKDMGVLDTSKTAFGVNLPILLTSSGAIPPAEASFTLVGNDYPAVLYRKNAGTPSFVADLVSADIQLSTNIHSNSDKKKKRGMLWDFLSGFFGFGGRGGSGTSIPSTFLAVPVVGPITSLPFTARHNSSTALKERDAYDFVRIQRYLNTTAIQSGRYRLLVRAQKITGNRLKQEDYETWLSPVFRVNNTVTTVTTTISAAANSTAV